MDYQTLRHNAREALSQAPYNPKKLALIYTGVLALMSLVLELISFFLARSFNAAVGLRNMDQRAILQTVQAVLSLANTVITPLWTVGFFAVALRNSRWSNAEPRDLMDGFRHWGTVLRLCILFFFGAFMVVFAASQIASVIFAITPLSRGLTQAVAQAMQTGEDPVILVEQLPISTMLPLLVILVLTLAALGIPLFYRFRLSFFAVAEGEPSARKALALSACLMHDNRMDMFKFDLRFWWYYGALVLIGVLGAAGNIVTLLNISLPFSRELLVYGAFGVSLVLRLLVCWQFSMEVRTTYALCYDRLKAQRLPPEQEATSDPDQSPWNQNGI